MGYTVIWGQFNKNQKAVKDIENTDDKMEKEKSFKKIARIILQKEGLTIIKKGPSPAEFSGVPFDFVACKDAKLALIEMKGTKRGFNYSSEVQFSRLQQVATEIKNRKIKHIKFLLQINPYYGVYQILDDQFYRLMFEHVDPKAGTARKNIPAIVDWIEKNISCGGKK